MTRTVRGLTAMTGLLALLSLSLGLGSPAVAGLVSEAEVNGAASNNSVGTAQAIPSSAFTTPVPATVFNPPGFPTATITVFGGANDVDFFSFTAPIGGSLLLDIDNNPSTFDTILHLFTSTTLLAGGDQAPPADLGSASSIDAFIGTFTLPGPGTYFVAVTATPNIAPNICSDGAELTRPDGGAGGTAVTGCTPGTSLQFNGIQPLDSLGYTLHISLSAPVPMPATLLLLSCAVAGIGTMRVWRSRP